MIRHIFGEALNALGYYRLRSALTMLSIIWGVASLMLLLSYGQGFERALTQAFLQIGKDLVVVFPGQTSLQAGGERSGRPILLELKDVKAIQEGVPTVEAVSPEFRQFYPLVFNDRTRSYSVAGVMPRTRGFAMPSLLPAGFFPRRTSCNAGGLWLSAKGSGPSCSAVCPPLAANSRSMASASPSLGFWQKRLRSPITRPLTT